MNKKILFSLMTVLLTVFLSGAQNMSPDPLPVGREIKRIAIDSITASYTDWNAVSMSGKLSTSFLPLSPSVKVYMEKGKLVVISVSTFWTGEAARIEVDKKEALIVNKLNNTFAKIPMSQIETLCPGGLEALQNLFLGRITILGSGELSKKDIDKIEIYEKGEDILLLPNQDLENAEYVYFYLINGLLYRLEEFVVMSADESGNVDLTYEWGKKSVTINFDASLGSRPVEALLQLDYPDTSPKKLSRIELGSKYRQVDLKGLLKF